MDWMVSQMGVISGHRGSSRWFWRCDVTSDIETCRIRIQVEARNLAGGSGGEPADLSWGRRHNSGIAAQACLILGLEGDDSCFPCRRLAGHRVIAGMVVGASTSAPDRPVHLAVLLPSFDVAAAWWLLLVRLMASAEAPRPSFQRPLLPKPGYR
ncbi:hypothetical protein VUR80DRAFT_3562 [Thermomyces stellatus]